MDDGAQAVSGRSAASAATSRSGLGLALAAQVAFWGSVAYFTLRHFEVGRTHAGVVDLLGLVTLLAAGLVPVLVWINGANAQKRLLATLTSLVVLIAGALFLSPAAQCCIFALSYVVVLTLLPAGFYAVFRAARGYSLADEFISNLTRLGIARSGDRQRLIAYVREFDALYGPLTPRQRDLIQKALSLAKDELPGDERGLLERIGNPTGEVRFPVMLATVLCALGWFATLSPVNVEARETVGELWRGLTAMLSVDAFPEAAATDAAGALAGVTAAGPAETPATAALASVLRPETTPAAFAFYGAYFFSLQLLYQRFMRRDLSSRSYVGTSMRLVLPAIATWVLVFVLSRLDPTVAAVPEVKREPWLLGLAFVIGALPLTVLTMLGNVFRAVKGISHVLPSLHSRRQLSELDGLTLWHQARLEEEDVDNIPGMATVDLVGLMISTRIPANRLVDWVDQAILLRHLPWDRTNEYWTELRNRLESRGVRMASGLKSLWQQVGEDPAKWTWLDAENGAAIAHALIRAAEDSPNLKLIESWKGHAAGIGPGAP